ncbi:type II toxin-antitoxin system VapB family antitoxin [Nocardia inohanensis]|uniref:type II toxin-antitoxin system VapB family antitoxin n=1 Tax=Nocardia inohanensis TaxID=209246 RepID=UPI0008303740|nr:type II toxin-antitoxin system VapB family antitoxin [Nocardia inohanensis]
MSRTIIDVDDEALAQVAELLGTSTKQDTVNAALRQVIARHRRAAALERTMTKSREGQYDDVVAPGRKAEAWR